MGAGSAGAVLAARLSEDPACRVLLLEAGGADTNPAYRVPIMTGVLAISRRGVWPDATEPEPCLANRSIDWPHGRVIGGSASINGMVWMRGRPSDYDRWARSGATGWGWDAVAPVYDALERRISISEHDGRNPLYDAFVQAGVQAGYPIARNFNRDAQEGVGRFRVNIARGRRVSSATGFLAPARRRPNLRVLTRTLAERILFEGRRAIGVMIRGAPAYADEIILCAGAINSPQLLMLSGIGDADALTQAGIEPIHHLPGVGRNLQDHVCVRVSHEARQPVSLHDFARLDRAAIGFLQAWLTRRGTGATTPFGAGFLLRSSPTEPEPDLESVFIPALSTSRLWAPLIRPAASGHGFLATVYQLRPESRGRITLRSPSLHDRPRIVANYLCTQRDRAVARTGVRLLRTLFAQDAFAPYAGRELSPACDDTDMALDQAIANTATTAYHPVGTCGMGDAANVSSVVDAKLRVHGLSQLRVADASVMPSIVSGNTNAACMMIGYRCADFVTEV